MPTNPDLEPTTTKPEVEPQAPKLYGFEDAFDETGQSLEDIIQSRVTSTPPRVTYEQAGKRVNSALKRYSSFGGRLFDATRMANVRSTSGVPGREIESLATADVALPGIDQYTQLVRRKIDAHVAADFAGNNLQLDDNEQAFMDAMEWSALREQRLAAPQEVTALDYQGSPHGAPYDTYEHAREDAIYGASGLHTQAAWLHAEAVHNGDTALADDMQRVMDDFDTYRDAFMTIPPTHTAHRNAAKQYGEELTAGSPTDATKDTMADQMNLDRVFATYDGRIKNHMKANLDHADLERQDVLIGHVENLQDSLAAESARSMRRIGIRRDSTLPSQHNYDIASEMLARQELRIAQRIGVQSAGTIGEKLPGSGVQVNAFLATAHLDRAKALDAKILRQLAENRTFADKAADFWAGKNNGEKEKRKTVNFVRRLAKVGAFAAMASFGPAGFALAAGTMIGAGKLSKYTSVHSNELRTRDMSGIVDERDLMRVIDARSISAQQKIRALRLLEKDRRNKDILKQQRRTQIAYGKAGLWAAGVGLSPVYAPWVAHAGLNIAGNGVELAKWSAGRF